MSALSTMITKIRRCMEKPNIHSPEPYNRLCRSARKAQGVTYAAAQLKLAKKRAEREAESSIKGNPRLEESFRSRRSEGEEEDDEKLLAERDRCVCVCVFVCVCV